MAVNLEANKYRGKPPLPDSRTIRDVEVVYEECRTSGKPQDTLNVVRIWDQKLDSLESAGVHCCSRRPWTGHSSQRLSWSRVTPWQVSQCRP